MNFELEFHKLLQICAHNSRIDLNQTLMAFYEESLAPYGYERVCNAIKAWMRKQKHWSMPTICHIEEELSVKITDRSQAEAIVGRIWESIPKFGFNSPKEARDYIGEAGWQVVLSFGGWYSLCTSDLDQGQTRAQMREFALSMMERARKGAIDETPSLPSSEKMPEQLNQALKLIGEKNGSHD